MKNKKNKYNEAIINEKVDNFLQFVKENEPSRKNLSQKTNFSREEVDDLYSFCLEKDWIRTDGEEWTERIVITNRGLDVLNSGYKNFKAKIEEPAKIEKHNKQQDSISIIALIISIIALFKECLLEVIKIILRQV